MNEGVPVAFFCASIFIQTICEQLHMTLELLKPHSWRACIGDRKRDFGYYRQVGQLRSFN